MGAAAQTDCRDLYNTQVIFKTHLTQNLENMGIWEYMETNFCGCRSQRRRAPLSYRQAQSSGGGVITVGIWIIKAGTRFIKQPYKPQRPPNYAPYLTAKGKEVKLPSERQTLSERLTGALRGCRAISLVVSHSIIFLLPFVLSLPKSTERAQKCSVWRFYIKSVKLPPRK